MKHVKKILLTFLLFAGSQLFSQIEKGSWMAGGSLGFGTYKGIGISTSSIYLNPNLGYFIAKNVPVGFDLSYQTGNNFTGFAIAPFVRGYLTIGKFYFLGHFRVAYANTNSNGIKGDSFGVGAGPGLGVFLNDYVALEGLFDYYIPDLGDSDINNMGFKIALQVYFPND